MITTKAAPISPDWTTREQQLNDNGYSHATATEVNQRLSQMEVLEIEARLVPFLAAAAAEMALSAGIPWRFAADDPPVALLRLIAKAGIQNPSAGGPHTDRLLDQLG